MKQIQIKLQGGYVLKGYLHDTLSHPCKSILIIPGGGFTHCEEREAEVIALAYVAQGFHAFCVYYVNADDEMHWQRMFHTVQEACDQLILHFLEWNLDTSGILVAGFSAGGHIALALAAQNRYISGIILGYPLISHTLCQCLHPSIPDVLSYLHENVAPIFLFSTWEDHVVPVDNALALLQACDTLKIPCEAHIFQHGHHGLSLAQSWCADGNEKNIDEHAAKWFPLSLKWLERLQDKKICE